MPTQAPKPYRLKRSEAGIYDVYVADIRLGTVRRDERAWSYEPWCIDGDTRMSAGGTKGGEKRRFGFRRLHAAAYEAAVMNSSALFRDPGIGNEPAKP